MESAPRTPTAEPEPPFSLFQVYGLEIEYAVVRRDTFAVDPSADRLLEALEADPAQGNVEADNELAAHVVELKARRPAVDLASQARDFAAYARTANRHLSASGCRLLPGGMHPFMDPARESRIWPHEASAIYQTYDRLFGVRGHGWFNIQSTHLNLPFSGDGEFARLHNAISLLLPVLPALAASSPVYEGAHHGWLSGRLSHYIGNQRRLPAIIGDIVPEPVGSEGEYRERILEPMYRAIAPLDSEGLMQEEWLNSRAAIARFSRGSIEIRCLDGQECPTADLAICHWTSEVLRMLVDVGGDLLGRHRKLPEGMLKSVFLDAARLGMTASLPPEYPCSAFGVEAQPTIGAFLKAVTARAFPDRRVGADAAFMPHIGLILSQGSLAERILRSSAEETSRLPKPSGYRAAYERLCDCLEADQAFTN